MIILISIFIRLCNYQHAIMQSDKKTALHLGQIVRQQRSSLGLTQTQLAAFAGCGIIFIHQLESGKATVRFDKLLGVLSALGLQMKIQLGKPAIVIDDSLTT